MSADNGLIVRFTDARYQVLEYDASTGSEYQLTTFRTLKQAVNYAQKYQQENVVEYGISFDLGEFSSGMRAAQQAQQETQQGAWDE